MFTSGWYPILFLSRLKNATTVCVFISTIYVLYVYISSRPRAYRAEKSVLLRPRRTRNRDRGYGAGLYHALCAARGTRESTARLIPAKFSARANTVQTARTLSDKPQEKRQHMYALSLRTFSHDNDIRSEFVFRVALGRS